MADRNTGRGAWYASVDVRATKYFPLGRDSRVRAAAIAEVSNLLDRTNFISVNDVIGTDPQYLAGPFNQTGSAAIPSTSPLGFNVAAPGRQLQVGLKVVF
jgi:hypothetical protein